MLFSSLHVNNQETDSHHSGVETDQKDDNLSSTGVALLSRSELDDQGYVPSRSSLGANQQGGFTMPRACIPPLETATGGPTFI